MTDKGITVLIVEDDVDLQEQMKIYLEADGYTVITASQQKEAEKIIGDKKFDLAILDLMMENMDSGFVLSHKIKRMDSSIPVIIVTGVTRETGLHFDAKSKEDKSWIKADVMLQKNVRYEQLKLEIERLLKKG